MNMLGPVGFVQKKFCGGYYRTVHRVQQDGSDFFSDPGGAGLSRDYAVNGPRLKFGQEMLDLCALTGAFDAFKGDEHVFLLIV
jgi:hypothetical protein